MNLNKDQLTFVNTVPTFNKMLADLSKNVSTSFFFFLYIIRLSLLLFNSCFNIFFFFPIKHVFLPTPEVAAIHWNVAQDFVEQDTSTNIFLAAFTTAWARLKLYEEMDKLGQSVLYHDTDSIIYASNGINDPPLGNFLGEFTDELDGDSITTFVSGKYYLIYSLISNVIIFLYTYFFLFSGGPKNYGFKTREGKTCCKVRGFTLNFRNAQLLNFDSIQKLVCEMDTSSTISIRNPTKITTDGKRRRVVNKEETKLYRVVYDKRVIQPDLTTLPYGY